MTPDPLYCHCSRVDAEMRGNLRQPISILPIGGVNEPRRLALSRKQHAQGRPLGLRLPARNVEDDPMDSRLILIWRELALFHDPDTKLSPTSPIER